MIPPGNDKVTIGDIERTRLNHIKILFFIGVNDGVVPKAGNAGGIISQFEREKMVACHLELAPGARENGGGNRVDNCCGLHHDAEEQHGVFPGGTAG